MQLEKETESLMTDMNIEAWAASIYQSALKTDWAHLNQVIADSERIRMIVFDDTKTTVNSVLPQLRTNIERHATF